MTTTPDADADEVEADLDLMVFSGVAQDFLEYPQPHFARMRARRPLLTMPGAVQTTTRAALDAALRNAETFSSGMEGAPLGTERPLIPLQIDPPEHLKYRKLLDPLFAPRQMARLEPQIRQQVNELVDRFVGRGSCDFTNEFAIPLPSIIFLRLFGLPLEDLPRLLEFNEKTQRPGGDTSGEQLARRKDNAKDVYGYFERTIEERRSSPARDDLLSKLLDAEVAGDRLSDAEIVDISFLMILAGLDTITDTLTCSFEIPRRTPRAPSTHRRRPIRHPLRRGGALALGNAGDDHHQGRQR